jgi:hypothetical protein
VVGVRHPTAATEPPEHPPNWLVISLFSVVSLLKALQVQARESSDSPRLNAFCRVAPSVRFKTLAIVPAGVFFRAADFNSRTSTDVHEQRFDFLAIKESPGWEEEGF